MTVTLIPARDNFDAHIMPTGPAPTMRTVGLYMLLSWRYNQLSDHSLGLKFDCKTSAHTLTGSGSFLVAIFQALVSLNRLLF